MSIDAVLEGLVQLGEDDWIALWVIAQDVEELLGIEDPTENLEVTITLVKELLKRGFLAGGNCPWFCAPQFGRGGRCLS